LLISTEAATNVSMIFASAVAGSFVEFILLVVVLKVAKLQV
jgi:hypothetical protein